MNELAKPHKRLDSPSIYEEKVPTQEHVARAIMNTLYNMIKKRQKSLVYSIHSPHSHKIRIQKDTSVKVQFAFNHNLQKTMVNPIKGFGLI